jgi:hypothetical protein
MRLISKQEYSDALSRDLSERFDMFIYQRFFCECLVVSTDKLSNATVLAVFDCKELQFYNVSCIDALASADMRANARASYYLCDDVAEALEITMTLAKTTLDCKHVNTV